MSEIKLVLRNPIVSKSFVPEIDNEKGEATTKPHISVFSNCYHKVRGKFLSKWTLFDTKNLTTTFLDRCYIFTNLRSLIIAAVP